MRAKEHGFTLIEIAVVLIIVALAATLLGPPTVALIKGQRRATTLKQLDFVEQALVAYVTTNRRLPCPADGSLPSTDANAGLERGGVTGTCTNNQLNGVLPWREIGISETDATDGWLGRFTYRVDPNLTRADALDMSRCDPAATMPSSPVSGINPCNCSAGPPITCPHPKIFLANKGLTVQDAAGTALTTSTTTAAYVLIAHGENSAGAFNSSGVLQTGSGTSGPAEAMNRSNQALVTAYVDDAYNGAAATYFDDIVRRQTILMLATKTGLGPRSP